MNPKLVCEGLNWVHLAKGGVQVVSCEHGTELSGFMKSGSY